MKKSTMLVFLWVIGTIHIAYAQLSIKGTIKDKQTNISIPGATIFLSDLKLNTISDNDGNFYFKNLKSADYILYVNVDGYKSEVINTTLKEPSILNIELEKSIKELNEVVITAVSRSTDIKNSPNIIHTIDAKKMHQNISTNLVEGLKSIAGVNTLTTGNAISKPIIRGLGYNRVITLNNGIKQEGQQWGDEHGIEIDEYAVNRVEIIKGPGSLMYGSDGIAGVINFIAPSPLPENQIKSSIISNYQTNANLIGYSISNAGNKNGLQWLGRFSNKLSGNYENINDDKIYNSGFREINGNLFLGINKQWGYSHFTASSFNSTINLPEGERNEFGQFIYQKANLENTETIETVASEADLAGYKIGFPHQKINHLSFSSNNFILTKNGSINFNIGYQNNKRKEYAEVLEPNAVELFFDLSTINYHLRYNFNEINNWQTTIGISGMFQDNLNRGEEYLIPNYHLNDIGAFITSTKNFKNGFVLSGGLRFDNRYINNKKLILNEDEEPTSTEDENTTIKFQSLSKNFNNLSGSIGLSYQSNKKSSFKLNLSRGFRAPNISEISSNGKHEGSFRYEYGNANLNSEISHQIDFGYNFNSEHITLELTPFTNLISNYIYVEKLRNAIGQDSIPDIDEPAPAFKYTQGNALLLGGEFYLDIHPHPLDWLHLENTFSYVQANRINQTDSLKNLPFIPAPRNRTEIRAQLLKNKYLNNAYVKFGVDHIFKQNRVFSAYGTETSTPNYTLLSVGFGFEVKTTQNNALNFYFSGENLANIAYQDHLSRLKYAPENPSNGRMGMFNMGRNFSFKIVYSL